MLILIKTHYICNYSLKCFTYVLQSMATFKAVVLPHQQKSDGSYNVKIRVTHNRKSKYIPTTLVAYKKDLTSKLQIKSNSALMFSCSKVIEPMVTALSHLGYAVLEDMDVSEVISYVEQKRKVFRLDFFEFADEYVSKQSEGSQKVYNWILGVFERFLGKRECDINDINKDMVYRLLSYIESVPKMVRSKEGGVVPSSKKRNVASSQKSCILYLATLHRAAKERYNDEDAGIINIPRSPFLKIKLEKVQSKGPDSLSVEEMQRVISYDGELTRKQRVAVDLFILSFAFRGMNIADLYELKKPKGEFTYYRKKTRTRRRDRAETRVLVPECLDKYISRVTDGEELISKAYKGNDPYRFTSNISSCITRAIQKILGRRVSFYAARDTFATLARNVCEVDSLVVDESLVHSSKVSLLDAYVQKDWSVIHKVQMSVISLFSWE